MENAFYRTNMIRAAWVNVAKGTVLEDKFSCYDREMRFDLYKDLDIEVRQMVVRMMREYYNEMEAQGNLTDIVTMGKLLVIKSHQRDLEFYVNEAAKMVVASWISEFTGA